MKFSTKKIRKSKKTNLKKRKTYRKKHGGTSWLSNIASKISDSKNKLASKISDSNTKIASKIASTPILGSAAASVATYAVPLAKLSASSIGSVGNRGSSFLKRSLGETGANLYSQGSTIISSCSNFKTSYIDFIRMRYKQKDYILDDDKYKEEKFYKCLLNNEFDAKDIKYLSDKIIGYFDKYAGKSSYQTFNPYTERPYNSYVDLHKSTNSNYANIQNIETYITPKPDIEKCFTTSYYIYEFTLSFFGESECLDIATTTTDETKSYYKENKETPRKKYKYNSFDLIDCPEHGFQNQTKIGTRGIGINFQDYLQLLTYYPKFTVKKIHTTKEGINKIVLDETNPDFINIIETGMIIDPTRKEKKMNIANFIKRMNHDPEYYNSYNIKLKSVKHANIKSIDDSYYHVYDTNKNSLTTEFLYKLNGKLNEKQENQI